MKELISSILIAALWLAICGSLFPGDHPTVPAKHPLSQNGMIVTMGGAPMWACFAMGLALGFAITTANVVAAFTAGVYIAANCT